VHNTACTLAESSLRSFVDSIVEFAEASKSTCGFAEMSTAAASIVVCESATAFAAKVSRTPLKGVRVGARVGVSVAVTVEICVDFVDGADDPV
jgi:hypothetical protein